MKKPWPVAFVQVMPSVRLAHVNDPTRESTPLASTGAVGSSAVSPAQTKPPRPDVVT